MITASSRSNDRATQQPVFTVSHTRQEKICKEVYDYLTRVKIRKLKEAVLQLNKIIRQMLK